MVYKHLENVKWIIQKDMDALAIVLAGVELMNRFSSSPPAAFHQWLRKVNGVTSPLPTELKAPDRPTLSSILFRNSSPTRGSAVRRCEFSPWTMAAMRGLKPLLFFAPLSLLVLPTLNFELQDTIHALIEENIHLHDQLENLTNALKELKRMLWHHANGTKICCSRFKCPRVLEALILQRFEQTHVIRIFITWHG